MIYGIDYLGGAKYPKVVLANHPRGWAAGFFAREFGDVMSLVTALGNAGRCPIIRIQLCWDGAHLYGDRWLPNALKEARRYEVLSCKSRIELSPFCEHTLDNPDHYLDAIQAAAPSCVIVNTVGKANGREGAFSQRYKNETHSQLGASLADNFSYDGADALTYPKVKARPKDILFLWTPRLNGKMDVNDRTMISQRKAWPDGRVIKQLKGLIS